MKKSDVVNVLKYLFAILLTTFILDKVVYYGLSELRNSVYTGAAIGKLNLYLQDKQRSEVLAFGSSRANRHLDTEMASKNSFNMGLDGTSIGFAEVLIQKLPTDLPQKIFLHVDPIVATDETYEGDDLLRFNPFYNSDKSLRMGVNNWRKTNVFQNFYYCLDFNNILPSLIKNTMTSAKPKDYFGFDPLVPTAAQKNKLKKQLAKHIDDACPETVQLNSMYKSMLDSIIIYCRKNQKELYLFTSPSFRDNCKLDNMELKKYLLEKKVNYSDYSDYFAKEPQEGLWKDKTHLARDAALRFSREIFQ